MLQVQPLTNTPTLTGLADVPPPSLTMGQAAPQAISSVGTVDNQQPVKPTISDDLKSQITSVIQKNRGKYSDGQILNGLISDNQKTHPEIAQQLQSWMGSPLNGSQRTDRNNNPIAAAVKTNGQNNFTKALDQAGIKWTYGDPFPGDSSMSTIKILGDPLQASKTILSATSSLQSWYGSHTGKAVLAAYGIKNNQDFANASPDVQNKIVEGIYNAENGTQGKSIPTGYDPKTILDGLIQDNKVTPPASTDNTSSGGGFWKSILGPELTAGASGIRAIQGLPSLMKEIWQAINDPNLGQAIAHPGQNLLTSKSADANSLTPEEAANQTLAKPIGNTKTYAGMSNSELLGSSTQALGQALMLGGNPFSGFGLQGFGQGLTDNKNIVASTEQGLISGLLGKGADVAAPFLGKLLGAATPQIIKDFVGNGASKVSDLLGQLGNKVNPTLEKLTPSFMQSNKNLGRQAIESVGTKLFGNQFKNSANDMYTELFTGTKSAGKNFLRSTDMGKDPAGFLSQRGILPDIADNGRISTQAAQNKVMTQEVEPLESSLKDIFAAKDRVLPDANKFNLDDLVAQAKAKMNTPAARGGGMLSDINNEIDNIFNNFKTQYGDSVNYSQLNEIRSGQWLQSKSFNPNKPFMADVNYAIGKSAQQKLLAESTEQPVQQILNHLSDSFDAIKNLGKIDGNVIKGGRLGRYFNQIIGAIVGSHFGPVGAIGGDIAGGYINGLLQNNAIANPIKRMILESIPQDSSLYDLSQAALKKLEGAEFATKAAQAPLSLPAPKAGSPNASINVPIAGRAGNADVINPGLQETANSVHSRVIKPTYTPGGGNIENIFPSENFTTNPKNNYIQRKINGIKVRVRK